MIKHILVPTDGSEAAAMGVRYATQVAKHLGAKLHGLHVVDIKLLEGPFLRDISASLGTAPYANYQGNIGMILEERGRAALSGFTRACEEAGVECDIRQATGLVVRSIIDESQLADLVILGRSGEHSNWLEGVVGSTTQGVVRRSPRPVLVTASGEARGGRFLVAYDGSHYAKQALHIAADIGVQWRASLEVLAVNGARGAGVLAEARAYLDPHPLEAEYTTRSGDPSETIVAYAGDRKADLLIMGAYGHTKVRELVVGSTTAYAMNHAPCPVLFAR